MPELFRELPSLKLRRLNEKLQQKQCCQNIHHQADFFVLSAEGQKHVGNHAESNTFGDAVREGHHHHGEKSGNAFGIIGKMDVFDRFHHKRAHENKDGCGSRSGNHQKQGRKKKRKDEQNGHHQRGEARASAFST